MPAARSSIMGPMLQKFVDRAETAGEGEVSRNPDHTTEPRRLQRWETSRLARPRNERMNKRTNEQCKSECQARPDEAAAIDLYFFIVRSFVHSFVHFFALFVEPADPADSAGGCPPDCVLRPLRPPAKSG
jgi:hypothetical protein